MLVPSTKMLKMKLKCSVADEIFAAPAAIGLDAAHCGKRSDVDFVPFYPRLRSKPQSD